MMGIYMPLLLGWFAYTLAAGLALYFVVSNTLAIAQALIMKRYRSEPEPQGKKKKIGAGLARMAGVRAKARNWRLRKNPLRNQSRPGYSHYWQMRRPHS